MSKKASTKRVAKSAAIPTRTAPKVTTAKHEHTWPNVKTNGRRIRYGCPCGHWCGWVKMTDAEWVNYGAGAAAVIKTVQDGVKSAASVLKDFREQIVVGDESPFAKIRARLAVTQGNAQAALTDKAMDTAAEAGVQVKAEIDDDAQCGLLYDHEGNGPLMDSDLPDKDDHSDTVVVEDFDPESLTFELQDWLNQPELSNRKADMCYLVLVKGASGTKFHYVLTRERAHAELTRYLKVNPDGAHELGDAVWDGDMGEWTFPKYVQYGVDGEDELDGDYTLDPDRDMVWMVVGDTMKLLDREDAEADALQALREGHRVQMGSAVFDNENGWIVPEDVLIEHGFAANQDDTGYHKVTAADVGRELSQTMQMVDEFVEKMITDEEADRKFDQVFPDQADEEELYHVTVPQDIMVAPQATFGPYPYGELIRRVSSYSRKELQFAMDKLGLPHNSKSNRAGMARDIVDHQIRQQQDEQAEEETPEEQAANPDRFYAELDFGTDRMAYANNSVGDLARDLSKRKRGELEFAARKVGINGVTTKVQKDILICALIAAADTTLVKEHRLNRAALILQWDGKVSGRDEWNRHYGLESAKPVHHHDDPEA